MKFLSLAIKDLKELVRDRKVKKAFCRMPFYSGNLIKNKFINNIISKSKRKMKYDFNIKK